MLDPEGVQPIDMDQLARVNDNFFDRLMKEGVTVTYDEDGDTLFVTIGQGVPALTEYFTYGVYIRIEPESLRIVGADILQFKTRFLANNELFRVMFGKEFEEMVAAGGTAVIQGDNARRFEPLFSAMVTG